MLLPLLQPLIITRVCSVIYESHFQCSFFYLFFYCHCLFLTTWILLIHSRNNAEGEYFLCYLGIIVCVTLLLDGHYYFYGQSCCDSHYMQTIKYLRASYKLFFSLLCNFRSMHPTVTRFFSHVSHKIR
jgi:hypothetical protein